MNNKKNGFILYDSYIDQFKMLPDKDVKALLVGIMEYHIDGTIPALSPTLNMAFSFIKSDIDRNEERYKGTCDRNRDNAKKRWAVGRDDATASDGIRPDANYANDADKNRIDKSREEENRNTKKEKNTLQKEMSDYAKEALEGMHPEREEVYRGWFAYKVELGKPFKTLKGLKCFFTQTEAGYPDNKAFKEAVEFSMASEYTGLFTPNNSQRTQEVSTDSIDKRREESKRKLAEREASKVKCPQCEQCKVVPGELCPNCRFELKKEVEDEI